MTRTLQKSTHDHDREGARDPARGTHFSRGALALLGLAVVVLAVHASLYYPFISDDSLISLRYSSRLLNGHGLTWTDGQPVEGYSNLLWVLLVAALGLFGLDLITAVRLLGVLGTATVMYVVVTVAIGHQRLSASWFPAATGLLFVSLSAPMAVWAVGGLEQPLVGALLAASVPLMYASLRVQPGAPQQWCYLFGASMVLGLLAVTRPDGPIFAVIATAVFLLCGRGPWRKRLIGSMGILSVPVLLYGAQLVFRLAYYGEWVPNTALVKLTPNAVRRADGFNYLFEGLQALSPFSFLAIAAMIGLLAMPVLRPRAVYLLSAATAWSLYIVFIGGDIFPAYRHFVPLIVLFAFALVELSRELWAWSSRRPLVSGLMATVTLLLFIPFSLNQYQHKQSQRAVTERWEWECRDLALVLKAAFSHEQPVVAVTAAGCLPYWSELPSIDMLGLNDHYLPRHPPPDFGTGFLGHELGNGAYILRRRPDIIVFSVGSEPSFRSGIEMAETREFHDWYLPVTFQVEGTQVPPVVYIDQYSPKVGIRQSASAITVPGFLFRSTGSAAYLNSNGVLVAPLERGSPLHATFTAAEWSTWSVDVIGTGTANVDVHVVRHDQDSLTITLNTDDPVTAEIEAVVLRRSS